MRQITIPENLMLDVRQDGGFTYHPDRSVPKKGYVVGKHNIMICHNYKPIPNDLFKIALEEVRSEPNTYIGGWFDSDSDKTYYDIVQIFNELHYAKEIARKRGELSIYDIENEEVIYV